MINDPGPFKTDVLILGGGIQGLWMLKDLRAKGYGAILLETGKLGGRQTLHSHLYIHQGHVYAAEELKAGNEIVEILRDTTARFWDPWIEVNRPVPAHTPSYFGFNNEEVLRKLAMRWGATSKLVDPMPAVFVAGPSGRPSCIKMVRRTFEKCLDGESLVQKLSEDLKDCIGQIREVSCITVDHGRHSPIRVEVAPQSGESLVFTTQGLVLAAGEGNAALLKMATATWPAEIPIRTKPETRKAHMLVIRGPTKGFEPLTGVFPDTGNLFLVSRQRDEDTIWLVSDGRSPTPAEEKKGLRVFDVKHGRSLTPAEEKERHFVANPRWWLPQVIENLGFLAPKYFETTALREKLKWGVYKAYKAEQAPDEHNERPPGWWEPMDDKSGLWKSGLWIVYPTKLTLAPRMSGLVLEGIKDLIRKPAGAPVLSLPRPEIAPEMWTTEELESWADFHARHALPPILLK